MFSEFATCITKSKDDSDAYEENFRGFEDSSMMKPLELWTLCDDSDYSSNICYPQYIAIRLEEVGECKTTNQQNMCTVTCVLG
jgi:hypothetical protein